MSDVCTNQDVGTKFFLMEKAACCLVDFGTAFLLYTMAVVALVLLLIFHYVPQCGHTHVLVYIAICSLMGSLSVPILCPFLLLSMIKLWIVKTLYLVLCFVNF
jgi:hypothetical protein